LLFESPDKIPLDIMIEKLKDWDGKLKVVGYKASFIKYFNELPVAYIGILKDDAKDYIYKRVVNIIL